MSQPSLPMPRTVAGIAPQRRFGWRVRLVIAALVVLSGFAWLAKPYSPAADGAAVDGRTFAHWRGEGHDWLLMAVPDEGALVVYDATDGRPLRRLPVAGVRDIVLEDDWLFVTSAAHPGLRLLHLPQLAWRHMPGANEAH